MGDIHEMHRLARILLNPQSIWRDCTESIIDWVFQVDVWRKTPRSAPSPSGRGLGGRRSDEGWLLELLDRAEILLAHDFLRLVRAIPRPRADLRVIAAGIRALVINGAQAALTIQVVAIVVAHALQSEDPVSYTHLTLPTICSV